ncbi:MAG TPA: HAMP domain-containing sensor histidine kinase [Vicinamibacterales bacterium]|nr:HAMP domain-containing sensor histidine kinase [Vicinamibacterales bacterium]
MTRDTDEVATLLSTAVMRDMRGVQGRVLATDDWADTSVSLADASEQVALAFTRYPYPESFFRWQSNDRAITFFNRVARYPAWLDQEPAERYFPVVLATNPPGSERLRRVVDSYGVRRYRYVVFNTQLGDQEYQIVARLKYGHSKAEEPQSVTGFTVNLSWVRQSYFPDLLSEVTDLSNRRDTLNIGVFDDRGALVWGDERSRPGTVETFPILFANPSSGKMVTPTEHSWTIGVSQASNSPLLAASQGADRALIVVAVAVCAVFGGLALALRAMRVGVALTAMRSDFVSSVTHELKMPLTNILAMAETMGRRPVPAETIQQFSGLLTQESKRLKRLINNLLAYARVTDIANAYSFEPIATATIVEYALQVFQHQLTERGFELDVDIPIDAFLVHVDRESMILVLDNLLDNAIRYSTGTRSIRVAVKNERRNVVIEIEDRGVGIPAHDLQTVQRKYTRGRLAPPGGSGLGLSIVARIVADHGGRFVLESRHGVGTTARVILPAINDDPA